MNKDNRHGRVDGEETKASTLHKTTDKYGLTTENRENCLTQSIPIGYPILNSQP